MANKGITAGHALAVSKGLCSTFWKVKFSIRLDLEITGVHLPQRKLIKTNKKFD